MRADMMMNSTNDDINQSVYIRQLSEDTELPQLFCIQMYQPDTDFLEKINNHYGILEQARKQSAIGQNWVMKWKSIVIQKVSKL